MGGTHGFGFGVTGAELRARIAALAVCPDCVGTGRRWSLAARASVPCAGCASVPCAGCASAGCASAVRPALGLLGAAAGTVAFVAHAPESQRQAA
jgi:hypothetical protein